MLSYDTITHMRSSHTCRNCIHAQQTSTAPHLYSFGMLVQLMVYRLVSALPPMFRKCNRPAVDGGLERGHCVCVPAVRIWQEVRARRGRLRVHYMAHEICKLVCIYLCALRCAADVGSGALQIDMRGSQRLVACCGIVQGHICSTQAGLCAAQHCCTLHICSHFCCQTAEGRVVALDCIKQLQLISTMRKQRKHLAEAVHLDALQDLGAALI